MFAVLNRIRKSTAGVIAGLGLLGLAACEPVAMVGGGPSIDTSRAVPVALLVPGGSGQASDELLARSLENAARLAMADLSGAQIDLRVYRTAGQASQAASAATRAIDDGASIILGPVFGGETNAAGLSAAAAGVNVLSFSNNADIAGGNVFVLGHTFRNTANRLVGYAARQGKGRILIVHENTTAGTVGRDAIARAIAATGGASNAGAVGFDFSQQGVVDALPRITAAVQSSGANAIFYTSDSAGALPLLTQLVSENGIGSDVAQYIGLTRWDIPQATLDLPGVQGGWFALPDPALNQQFQSRYTAAYGEPPHPIAGLAYDGVAAIGALISSGRADALTGTALTQGSGFVGVNGVFRLRRDGTNDRGLAVAQVRNRQANVIDPAPRSFTGPGF
jgi:hypothetical protein